MSTDGVSFDSEDGVDPRDIYFNADRIESVADKYTEDHSYDLLRAEKEGSTHYIVQHEDHDVDNSEPDWIHLGESGNFEYLSSVGMKVDEDEFGWEQRNTVSKNVHASELLDPDQEFPLKGDTAGEFIREARNDYESLNSYDGTEFGEDYRTDSAGLGSVFD